MSGHVSLVGAGPGDPELLTRRALTRLRKADLVLYDALVDERVLTLARRAHRFFVGKRAGRHALTQAEIHALMVRAARRNRRVVRLKGGDPFVFGRGGEEALALQRAGIPFDIVPGISSAIAAPAAAGIPVTHRGLAAAVLIVSGHEEETFARAVAQLEPAGFTLVVMMGVARRQVIADALLRRGWAPATPAAMVAAATRPDQHVWRGTLGDLAQGAAAAPADAAATLVIGDVASLSVAGAISTTFNADAREPGGEAEAHVLSR
jgi:uroporphyrin-III C-methyltransferase/precorrin-2 dehydrogenase/sirohydrochlorin ferrochelatase